MLSGVRGHDTHNLQTRSVAAVDLCYFVVFTIRPLSSAVFRKTTYCSKTIVKKKRNWFLDNNENKISQRYRQHRERRPANSSISHTLCTCTECATDGDYTTLDVSLDGHTQ